MKKSDNRTFAYSVIENYHTPILPFFIRPHKDELFSSWLIRCSYLYKAKPHVFSKFIWGSTQIWNRDIDKSIKIEDLNKFSELNHTSLHDGFLTTLKSFEGILFDEINVNGQCKLITTAGIYHRKRKHFALMYCPVCLRQNKYFRKNWRLAILISCPTCKVYLLDRCYNCGNPLMPFRLNVSEKGSYSDLFLNYCWCCKFDLCEGPTIKPPEKVLKFTAQVDKYLNDNSMKSEAREFFKELIFFVRILTSNRKLIIYLANKEICRIPNVPKPLKNFPIEMLSLENRKEVIQGLIYLLSDWPKNFVKFIKENNVKYSELVFEKSHKKDYPIRIEKYLSKF